MREVGVESGNSLSVRDGGMAVLGATTSSSSCDSSASPRSLRSPRSRLPSAPSGGMREGAPAAVALLHAWLSFFAHQPELSLDLAAICLGSWSACPPEFGCSRLRLVFVGVLRSSASRKTSLTGSSEVSETSSEL